jgi:hypothetical protein
MTRLAPRDKRSCCRSLLSPSELAVRILGVVVFSPTADDVRLTCGLADKWDGTPRTLEILAAVATVADDGDGR